MQVHYDEGIANHIGPEPCAGVREGVGEASVGERAGQPLSRDRKHIPGADAFFAWEGEMPKSANASAWAARRGQRTWHARTLLVREPGGLGFGQQCDTAGPHREDEESKPMMHEPEKSDSAVVATKPANKAGRSATEPVERRAGPRGTAVQQSMCRAQYRVSMSQALGRVREAAALRGLSPITQGKSRMREFRSYGSVRGARGDLRPYRKSA